HPIDHSHEVELKAEHRFSERYKLGLNDSFVYAQEPEIIEGAGAPVGAPTRPRTDADVLRNRASLDFRAQATELLGVALGYQNSWYDYRQDGAGSRSALLDRLEHLFRVDARWQALPSLVGLVGYEFGINNYTADEPLTTALNALTSKARDNRAQYFY